MGGGVGGGGVIFLFTSLESTSDPAPDVQRDEEEASPPVQLCVRERRD